MALSVNGAPLLAALGPSYLTWDQRVFPGADPLLGSGDWRTWELGASYEVTSTLETSWGVAIEAAATLASTWNVGAEVSSTLTSSWAVRSEAQAELEQTWAVREQGEATLASTWAVAGQATSTLASTWDVLVSVQAELEQTWSVRSEVTATLASSWAVRAAVLATSAQSWNVRASVEATLATSWAVRAAVSATLATAWAVEAQVTVTLASTWDVADAFPEAVVELSTTWNVAALAPLGYCDRSMRHLFTSRMEVLAPSTALTGGRRVITWVKLGYVVDPCLSVPGELEGRLSLGYLRPGAMNLAIANTRIGTFLCPVTDRVQAGHRLRAISGPIRGTFDIKATPDPVGGFSQSMYVRFEVVEVAQPTDGAVIDLDEVTRTSGMRHLYSTLAQVLRQETELTGGRRTGEWLPVSTVLDAGQAAGQIRCRLAMNYLRPGMDAPPAVIAGTAPGRQALLFADLIDLRKGDRIQVLDGPNQGTFELRAAPDVQQMMEGHHLQVQVYDVSQRVGA